VAPDGLTENQRVLQRALIDRESSRRQAVHAVRPNGAIRSIPMLDILMLAFGLGFFALAIGYTYACERL
jgi:hypothetical protein